MESNRDRSETSGVDDKEEGFLGGDVGDFVAAGEGEIGGGGTTEGREGVLKAADEVEGGCIERGRLLGEFKGEELVGRVELFGGGGVVVVGTELEPTTTLAAACPDDK